MRILSKENFIINYFEQQKFPMLQKATANWKGDSGQRKDS